MSSLLSNVANSKLVSAITAADVSLSLTGGSGALFPTLSNGNTFNIVLEDSAKNIEICRVTARDGDVLTVVRGQENTTPRIYDIGDRVALRMTAAAFNGKENIDRKDTSGGYAGLTLYKINFKNADGTITSFIQNANTAERTYTFQNRSGTIADLADLALKADLSSPALTDVPTAPTAAPGTNTTQIATCAFTLANNFPVGTRMSFNQTNAPTGWVKDTNAAINDSILRIVVGNASLGGATAFSAFNAQTAVGATTLTLAQIPSHTHQLGPYSITGNINASGANTPRWSAATDFWGQATGTSGSAGGSESHTHTLTTNIKYTDFIIAQKS